MRLDVDGLDRSPLDLAGETPGEIIASIYISTPISVTLSNDSFRADITISTPVSVSFTANSADILADIAIKTPISVAFVANSPLIEPGTISITTPISIALTTKVPLTPAISIATPLSVTFTANSADISAAIAITTPMSVKFTPTINLNKLLMSATIKRSLSDRMASATFNFDKTTYAGIYSSIYWTKLVMRIPDYAGNWNVVFSGIAPSSRSNFTHVKSLTTPLGNQSVTAYDYQWYLTSQTIEPADLVLLKWAEQQTDYIYKLEYKNLISGRSFTVGDVVKGVTSRDFGTVIEVNSSSAYIRLRGVYGSAPYYQDSEYLAVGNTAIAQADGAAVDDSGTITQKYPTDYVKKLLGEGLGTVPSPYGSMWAEVSGIYPKPSGFTSDAGWAEKEFVFTPTTTKAQAIEEICRYMGRIFYVRYETVSGTPAVPCAYFFDQSDLDTVGCLPDPVYVTAGQGRASPDYYPNDAGGYMIAPFTLEQKGENQYNWVQVRCQALDGKWYQALEYDSDVYDSVYNSTGTVQKIPYYEINRDIATSTDCSQRASDVWDYYGKQVCTWSVTFELRSDLALLQKLIVSGFSPALPDGDYRIIDIEYDYDSAGTRNYQKVKIIADADFAAFLNLKRVFTNSINEIQNVIQDLIGQTIVTETGTVVGTVSAGYEVLVAVNGSYGSVTRSAKIEQTNIVPGDRVLLHRTNDGKLVATLRGDAI